MLKEKSSDTASRVTADAIQASGCAVAWSLGLWGAIGPLKPRDLTAMRRQTGIFIGFTFGAALIFGLLTTQWIVPMVSKHLSARDLYGKTNMFTAQAHADRVGRVFVARDYWGRLAHEIPAAMQRASTCRMGSIETKVGSLRRFLTAAARSR